LLAPIGAVFVAWSDNTVVRAWLERAEITGPADQSVRHILAEIRARGFSVPLQAISSPAVTQAIKRVRNKPADEEAEHALTGALQQTDEMLLLFEGLAPTDEVTFKTVAAPVFDEIGRVPLSISITGPDHPVTVQEVMRLGRRLLQSAAIATREGHGRMPRSDLPKRTRGTG
jgi:hypothetical protein